MLVKTRADMSPHPPLTRLYFFSILTHVSAHLCYTYWNMSWVQVWQGIGGYWSRSTCPLACWSRSAWESIWQAWRIFLRDPSLIDDVSYFFSDPLPSTDNSSSCSNQIQLLGSLFKCHCWVVSVVDILYHSLSAASLIVDGDDVY